MTISCLEQNYPPKTFEQLKKKAEICIAVARLMLGEQADRPIIEDQAVDLMHLPDHELDETHKRLAAIKQTATDESWSKTRV